MARVGGPRASEPARTMPQLQSRQPLERIAGSSWEHHITMGDNQDKPIVPQNQPFRPETRIVRCQGAPPVRRHRADVCVVGSGISGVSAAIESARLGKNVILIDGLPTLGGQAVNSIIGMIVGLFGNGPNGKQLTHGIADDILRDLGATGDLEVRMGGVSPNAFYNEVALGRWIERKVLELNITPVVGAILRKVRKNGRRITELELATRYGDVAV